MSGSVASRSPATWPSAAGIWPFRCAWRPSSASNVSKMPYVVSLTLKAYQVTVPLLLRRQFAALAEEVAELVALAGLGLEQGQDSERRCLVVLLVQRRAVGLRPVGR